MIDSKVRFSYGEISPDLIYRSDTQIPSFGVSYLKNATMTYSAGLTNLPKLEKTIEVPLEGASVMKPFKYKIVKKDTTLNGYLFLFTDKKALVLRMDNFQKVGEVASNYTPDEIKKLSMTQFDNSIIICCENKKPVMIRVDETTPSFTVVQYWENIKNPPVKRLETEFSYTGEDKVVFKWYKQGANVIFESLKSEPIFNPDFLNTMKDGVINIYGGSFAINKIENPSGKQKITTTQRQAPELEVPSLKDLNGQLTPEEELKVNILDFSFSESLFRTGYPAVVTNYKGRVIFGNIGGNPSVVCASRVFDSLNFRQSTDDSDGFTSFISSNELNTVKDFVAYKSLLVFTDKGVFSTLLNEGLTPSKSEFYNQKLPRPKGLGYWIESDGNIVYVDSTDRVIQIQDVGSDNTYISNELSIYSGHLLDNINDIYFFKLNKNNMLGIDQEGNEARILTYKENPEEGRQCWSRAEKVLEGYNKYITIDDELYIASLTTSKINFYKYSKTKYEPMHIITETSLASKFRMDVPEYLKKTRQYGKATILLFGKYNLQVNGISKAESIKYNLPKERATENKILPKHIVEFPYTGKQQLEIIQKNNEKLEIIGIFVNVDGMKGEDE